jgi:hypothetical protein
MSEETRRRSKLPVVLAACVATAIGSFWLLQSKGEKTPSSSDAASKAAVTSSAYPLPSVARPEEAKRYFDAMIEGDTRAIALIDEALAKAKTSSDGNAAQLRELERLRNDRAARLAAHVAAQPRNTTGAR